MRVARIVGALVAVSLAVAGCNRNDGEPAQTSAPPATISVATTAPTSGTEHETIPPDTTVADRDDGSGGTEASTTVATTTVVSGLPTYEVVHRLIEDDHETLVIVVEPGAYSDVELENLVYDVVERFSPNVAIVVDDPAVADLAILDRRTEDEQEQLDAHTFLRIENGVEVTFHGPYADFPGLTVGS